MIKLARRTVVKAMLALVVCTEATRAGEWTDAVDVLHDFKRCVSYRARLAGEFLVVQATHEAGWHTYAMDNRQRAEEKLAGKQALAVDSPTEIRLTHGLEVAGPWYQSSPKDFSRPELQLFTWGFEGHALLAAKVRRSGTGPAQIAVSGQACTETICKKIDVVISLPLAGVATGANPSDIDFKALVRVRQARESNSERSGAGRH
ncbi:MAG: hypothetical protein HY235_26705 [Acidobacteria bacterium]|nr:hypothetical protein [Acidobacteriota bacterium]